MKTLAAATLTIVLSSAGWAQTPEATVTAFVKAINRRDFAQMEKLVKGAKVTPGLRMMFEDAKLPAIAVERLSANTNGNSVRVTMQLTIGNQKPTGESVVLEKSGTTWRLTPEKENMGVLNMLATGCVDGGAVFTRAKSAAQSTACMSNLKQLALGVIMFTMDQDDVFRMSAGNWQSKILAYTKNADLHHCKVTAPNGAGYSFNAALTGKSLARMADPAKVVMLYEGKNGKLSYHPDGKAAVAFADGHVKRITAAEAAKLRWKP